jgi:hypothetical protein
MVCLLTQQERTPEGGWLSDLQPLTYVDEQGRVAVPFGRDPFFSVRFASFVCRQCLFLFD